MAKISELPDDLLVKILTFLPTKVAVSTSVLSKQWEFLWMWLPELKFDCPTSRSKYACLRDFIAKNLPLHKAPIENLHLSSSNYAGERLQPEDLESWVGIAVSPFLRELSIYLHTYGMQPPHVSLPSSLYTCKLLVTLKLHGHQIIVDVPPTVCLPSLKTLELEYVTYTNDDSVRRLLSNSLVLADLRIERHCYDNVKVLVVGVPSLQRLFLYSDSACPSDGYVIVTPSLKFFDVLDYRGESPYSIEHMPELEEADITLMEDIEEDMGRLLTPITNVKRLSILITFNSGKENVYPDGIVFSQLETLKLYISRENWSKLLVQLLKDSPNLRILDLELDSSNNEYYGEYEPVGWSNNQGSVPKCFLNSLETFKFEGYVSKEQEDRDFLSFIFKHACCLKSTSVVHI